MPDLNIEHRWICKKWHDYRSQPEDLIDPAQEPKCKWNEEYDEGKPTADGKCPVCGGEVTTYRIGV